MNAVDRFRTRVAEAFGAMILTLMATVGGVMIRSAREATPATEPATSLSIDLTLGLITSLPGLVTLAGIMAATLVAGPFGFVGALLETAGATQLLYHQSEAGFWMVVFGAGLVTVGASIPWGKVLEAFLDSGGRY
ncbi:hypothetical protein BDK61_0803 [Haloarcula quadrata]|uniref:Uncharacterized protein n=1 Tax=Haloarcula quadrata TaxID=182779 RepID=A0A495R2J0_9EURY|nr:hypothetical protein [Haloarcula quadrata]RKS81517.1 hypothetical protein BDK61_0803 [Haloarcula quadrata]